MDRPGALLREMVDHPHFWAITIRLFELEDRRVAEQRGELSNSPVTGFESNWWNVRQGVRRYTYTL